MTFHIPRPVLLAAMLLFAIGVGVAGALLVGGGDGERAVVSTAPMASEAGASPTAKATIAPKPRVRLRVRDVPKEITADVVTIRGRTTRGATVTVRGKRALVMRGIYHVRLKMRLGVNLFTVVARRDGHRTNRRRLRIRRVPPPPPQQQQPQSAVPPQCRGIPTHSTAYNMCIVAAGSSAPTYQEPPISQPYTPTKNGSCETDSGADPDCPNPGTEGR